MVVAKSDSLKVYKAKRNFSVTPEPVEGGDANAESLSFVIQKHWASHLHYDFRLELDGTMKSWAVPKGPSFDPAQKRMAVHVEDHPISYNSFEGQIPARQYGAGKVIIWDKGIWVPLEDPHKGYKDGKLKFELRGHKLHGHWTLVRMKGNGEKQEPWLLIKEKDEFVRSSAEFSVVDEQPDSVAKLESPPGASTKKTSTTRSETPPTDMGERAALPANLKPQLATLVDAPPRDADEWLYEIKFDGYRLLSRIDGNDVQLFTRNGNDWTSKMPHIVKALKSMKLKPGWIDGEIVVLNGKGIPDFQSLQNAFDNAHTENILYFVFDVPFYDGRDLRTVPLEKRREVLRNIFEKKNAPDAIRFSQPFEYSSGDIVGSACRLGLEGVIGKRKDSSYVARRSPNWIKLKCGRRQEFVIGGYTDPQGSRGGIGSLLLGVHDEKGVLHYAGNVGTGFSVKTLRDIRQKLDAISADTSPFAKKTAIDRKAHWVKPTLLAEVAFAEWTSGGHVRQAVFHGLRTDKSARSIVRELAMHEAAAPKQKNATGESSARRSSRASSDAVSDTLPKGLRVTNPERVIDASTGATKIDLVRYYGLVAPLILEHLKSRPVSLVRAPDGITGELFFQKHIEAPIAGIKQLDQALDPGHAPLMEVATLEALLSAAQMNVIEFHTWNAVKTAIDKPDRMTFDLDPGEGVAWPMIQECAELVRVFLEQLGLRSFIKTSGGKGLHVVVPIKRKQDWDTVKDFSQAIVQHLAKTLPQRFVAKSGPRNRVGKVFVDYLRNGFGATTVAAWSVRSRPGLGVSVPIEWSELSSLTSAAQWSVSNIHTRLDVGNAAWKDYAGASQNLSTAMKTLGFTPSTKS